MDFSFAINIGDLIIGVISVIISANLLTYRVKQLEKKVEKHNNMIERMYKAETRIEDIRGELNELKSKI